MKLKILLLFLLPLGIAGCVTYRPLPLDDKITLATSVSHLAVDTSSLSFHTLTAHRFDPSDGLDMTEVAMLAVANNPNLRLARDDAKTSNAQAFAAGLLPDPQFDLSRDFPRQSLQDGTTAISAGLGYNFGSLVSLAAGAASARFESQKTDLNLLWQEWQTVAQARLLFSRAITQKKLLRWLTENRDFLADRYAASKAALAEGNMGSDVLNSTLSAWQDAARQVNDLDRQQLQTHNELNALLGLAPGIELNLVEDAPLGVPDATKIQHALDDLPSRRPDLLALKAGYAAQDARYRQAILAQFPPLNLSVNRSRDTGNIYTHGFALSMALPLLNGNRGNIRIAEATRQRLRDEYQVRINTAYAEVRQLLADSRLIAGQLQMAQDGLQTFDRIAADAGQALNEGNLDQSSYALFQSSRIAKHVEAANLQQALLENRIALLALLGGDFETHPVVVGKSQ